MKMNRVFALKASALAVSLLFGSQAFAAAQASVNFDAATPVAQKYASEQNVTTSADLLTNVGGATLVGTATLGASFATGAVAYVRVDLSSGVFKGIPTFAVADSGGGAVTSIAQGGTGLNYVIFAVAPSSGTTNLVNANSGTFTAVGGITVTSQAAVNATYRLYETLTNAANTTLALKTVTSPFVAFSPAFSLTSAAYDGTATSAVADVAATTPYSRFLNASTTVRPLAKITGVVNAVSLQSGALATVGDVLAATNSMPFAGDFSAARNAAGTYTGAALTRVRLDNATCSSIVASASTLSATAATFTGIAAATLVGSNYLCLEVEPSVGLIPASTYTGSAALVAQTGYTVTTPVPVSVGAVTRNGSQIDVRNYIPAAVTGYIQTVRLYNGGSSAVDVSVSLINEATGVAGTPAVIAAQVPAQGSVRLSQAQIEAAVGAQLSTVRPRLRFTAPTSSLQVQSFFNNANGAYTNLSGTE